MIERNTSPFAIVVLIVFGVLVLGIWSLGGNELLNPLRARTDADIRLTDHALSVEQTAVPAAASSEATRVAVLQTAIPLQVAATAQALSFSATAAAIQSRQETPPQTRRQQSAGDGDLWALTAAIVIAVLSLALTVVLIVALLRGREREARLQKEKQALEAIAHSSAVWAQRLTHWMSLSAEARVNRATADGASGESATPAVAPRRDGHMSNGRASHVDLASLNGKGGRHD